MCTDNIAYNRVTTENHDSKNEVSSTQEHHKFTEYDSMENLYCWNQKRKLLEENGGTFNVKYYKLDACMKGYVL